MGEVHNIEITGGQTTKMRNEIGKSVGEIEVIQGQFVKLTNAVFENLNKVHEKFHKTCATVISLYQANDKKKARSMFQEIKQLSEETLQLLDQLKTIQR